MDGFTWAAASCYLLAVIFGAIFGVMYMVTKKAFHYHEWVMGKKWDQLDIKMQTLVIGLMKGVGGAMLALAVALGTMIFFAFRSGQTWSYYAIPAVGLISFGTWLYIMIMDRNRVHARTPIMVPVIGIVLMVLGFVLSFF